MPPKPLTLHAHAAIGFFVLELALKALLTPVLLGLLRAKKGDAKARFTVTLAVARIVGAVHNAVQVSAVLVGLGRAG